jgi:hypothetical protein
MFLEREKTPRSQLKKTIRELELALEQSKKKEQAAIDIGRVIAENLVDKVEQRYIESTIYPMQKRIGELMALIQELTLRVEGLEKQIDSQRNLIDMNGIVNTVLVDGNFLRVVQERIDERILGLLDQLVQTTDTTDEVFSIPPKSRKTATLTIDNTSDT